MPACLGLDYGLRRIGIAANSADVSLALAVGTHVEGRDGSIFELLGRLVTERNIQTIVVGLPLTSAGQELALATKARIFADKVAHRLGVDVVMWDERYSTQEADRWLKESRGSSREDRDALAAEIILQNYLDSLAATPPGAEE